MARIGGAFPLPLAQVQEGGTRVALPSGGVWYPPAGEGLVVTDVHSVFQYWDGQAQSWQTLFGTSQGGFVSVDGVNFRALNNSGVVTVAVNAAGSGMTNGIGSVATGVSFSIAASDTTGGARATGYAIIGGTVAAPTITQAGSGFLVPPLITIDPPPPGGIQATATCALSATGTIASVTVLLAGAGYAASPNFWVTPQTAVYQGGPSGSIVAGTIPPAGLVFPSNAVPGNQNTSATGVQLTSVALTGSGTLTGTVVVNSGGGYTTAAPAVTFNGGAGGVSATATTANTTPTTATVLWQPRVQ